MRVFNDHLLERVDLRVPAWLASRWVDEAPDRDLAEMAADYLAGAVRSLYWPDIVKKAASPHQLGWTAYPPERRKSAGAIVA